MRTPGRGRFPRFARSSRACRGGRRRLRALNAFTVEKHIPGNHPALCLVVDAAAESLPAKNVEPISMHLAD